LKIVASVLELPLERTESEAGAAYGAALLGGVAGGVFDDARVAAQAGVKTTGHVDPDPSWVEAYAAERPRYQALYPALSGLPASRTTHAADLQASLHGERRRSA
jgi:xylulokinase